MEDDLIVVDDIDDHSGGDSPGPSGSHDPDPTFQPTHSLRKTAQRAITRQLSRRRSTPPAYATEGRTTRSAARPKLQPKLKLKLSEKAASQAPGMSFLGPYDRELDSDDEDLVFEEQFVLRMPPGEDCERLRKMVASREVGNDVWFKFKDSRRAVFHVGNNLYSSKLVDLPCVIESQKTLDNKQMFKVADICQMLVVENPIDNEDAMSGQKNFNVDEFIWPHGITPPLHHVRKRRFRKRVNRRTIETVEQEVERLLEEDALASDVKYDVLENVNPDLSDSEYIDREPEATTPGYLESEMGDVGTPDPNREEDDGEEEDEEGEGNEEGEGDIDEELAAELDLALGDEEGDGDDEEEDDDDDESDDDDEDDDDEMAQSRKLLNEEIRDLEAAVAKKGNEIASSANPLIRRRFEDALKKLQADLEMKLAQRDEMKEQQRLQKEGIAAEDVDTEGGVEDVDAGEDEGDDDLFGEDPSTGMDIG